MDEPSYVQASDDELMADPRVVALTEKAWRLGAASATPPPGCGFVDGAGRLCQLPGPHFGDMHWYGA